MGVGIIQVDCDIENTGLGRLPGSGGAGTVCSRGECPVTRPIKSHVTTGIAFVLEPGHLQVYRAAGPYSLGAMHGCGGHLPTAGTDKPGRKICRWAPSLWQTFIGISRA